MQCRDSVSTRVRLERKKGMKPVWCGCGADTGGSRRAGLAWTGVHGQRRSSAQAHGQRRRRAREVEGGPDRWGPPGGERGGEKADWAGRRKPGPAGGEIGPAGKKKGKRDGLRSWAENGNFFFFSNSLKQIQIKFKLKEFEFKLNHKHLKQCKVAWMHNNKTTSFNFIKPTNHYLFLLNSL